MTYIDKKFISAFLQLVSEELSFAPSENEVYIKITKISSVFHINFEDGRNGGFEFKIQNLFDILKKLRILNLGVTPQKVITYADFPRGEKEYEFDTYNHWTPDMHSILFKVAPQMLSTFLRRTKYKDVEMTETKYKSPKDLDWITVGKLKFNSVSGDFILNNVKGNFAPDTQEFKVLLKLLTGDYFQEKDAELLKEIYPMEQEFGKYKKMKLSTVLKNVKKTMKILPARKRLNKDIFRRLKSWKGYKIMESK